MNHTAADWIKTLKLRPHPEGGWFRETYRSRETIAKSHLPERYKAKRTFCTSIYFLLQGRQFSAFHRLKSDEIWHFYDGAPINIFIIKKGGQLVRVKLGAGDAKDEVPQYAIKAGSWFAAVLAGRNLKSQASNPKSKIGNRKLYALLGCTVAPGFDFNDFELGTLSVLRRKFPRHRNIIEKLTFK